MGYQIADSHKTVHQIKLIKGNEVYSFEYGVLHYQQIADVVKRFAGDPDLSLNFDDADKILESIVAYGSPY